jgi:hypothetical protein
MIDSQLQAVARHVRHGLGERRQAIGKAIGIGAGIAAISSSAQADEDPSPTPGTGGQFGIEPTATSPSSILPTPTQGQFASQPTSTASSEPPPEEPTETPMPETSEPTAAPTATQASFQAEEPIDGTGQAVPCPHPFSPFGWFCLPWPGGPWYPVFPSDEVANLTGVHWYGVNLDGETGALTGTAFARGGQELSRCEVTMDGEMHVLSLSDAQNQLDASLSVEFPREGVARIVGQLNGEPIDISIEAGEPLDNQATALPLDRGQELLLLQWSPAFEEVSSLVEIASPEGSGPLEGPGKCAVLGFFTGIGCIGAIAAVPLLGVLQCYENIQQGSSQC